MWVALTPSQDRARLPAPWLLPDARGTPRGGVGVRGKPWRDGGQEGPEGTHSGSAGTRHKNTAEVTNVVCPLVGRGLRGG
ncbi:hypothetical protein E2C01_059803 [Portunus trituberculatus]|uniref:Uncharacterized protein n=1 Tax=Portunus trituberculatus TaxID=210409 RepID=A0A5B7H7M7_PORTR|nr:hypothetical protein [Portunus trituberculatus]